MLYLCATPIGNMEDITMRVLRVLNEADAIYAEDTRHSGQLLAHFDIKKPLFSCHEHNEAQRAEEICRRIENGENIAYISDAGMPCISDPGARIIKAASEKKLPYTVLPGACAAVTALALSALDTDRFTFFGFLPRSGKERKEDLEKVAFCEQTAIVYESPNRVYDTLCDLKEYAGGDRQIALVREITKMFEERVGGSIDELISKYENEPPKGECVLVISAYEGGGISQTDVDSMIKQCLQKGMKAKVISKQVSDTFGVSKNDVYKRVLEIMEESDV